MEVGFIKYIDNLINVKAVDPLIGAKQPRWICNRTVSYVEKSKIPTCSIKKIERVLGRLDKDFKKFHPANIDRNASDKLETLIHLIEAKVQNYKNKHGKIYLFFSRLFFGNIDKISKNLILHLEDLRKNYNPDHHDPRVDPLNREFHLFPQMPLEEPQDPFDNIIDDEGEDEEREWYFPGFNRFNQEPVFTPAKQKRLVRQPFQPAVEDFLNPPVYGPYVPPIADESKKLENQVKGERLKFYEIFAEKIQVPQPDGKDEKVALFLPIIEITEKEAIIRLPKTKVPNGFDAWLDQQLKDRQIPCVPKAIGKVIKMGNKEITTGIDFDGKSYVKEYRFSLEEAAKLIKDTPNKGIGNLAKLVRQPEFKVHPFHENKAWGAEPSIENTLSLTFARLDPKLNKSLGEIKSNPLLHEKFSVPLVEFDVHGMIIKIPEIAENLKELMQQIFGFKGESIEETHFDRKYFYSFQINRDDIVNVLKQLGLDKIPSKGLFKRYEKGDITYLQHLIQTRRYHAYVPVRTIDALESIGESLAAIVSNEREARPYVSYHPRGWLSIKLPEWSYDYNQRLAAFLKCEPLQIQHNINDTEYVSEIIIHDENLPQFLKDLKLENTPDNSPYLQRLREYAGRELLEVIYAEDQSQLDLTKTIARTLSALDSHTKNELKLFNNNDLPECKFSLAEVSFSRDGMQIKIPKDLNNRIIYIGPGKALTMGEYLSHVFGIDGQMKNVKKDDRYQEFYCLNVRPNRVKSFLEKDLSLRFLPSKYKKSDILTFYHQVYADLGYKNHKRGSIVNLRLRNPEIPIPDKIPEMSDKEIIENLKKILKTKGKGKFDATYVAVFADTIKRITPGNDNPDIKEYDQHKWTATEIRVYLKLFIDELLTNKTIEYEQKRAAIAEIAEGCKGNTCLPGRLTKIEGVYGKLKSPELEDNVKFLLLEKVDDFKNNILAGLFKDSKGKAPENNVHIVNAAKIIWGRPFGLRKEAGEKDEGLNPEHKIDLRLIYLTAENRKKFRQECNRLCDGVFILLSNDKDKLGCILKIGEYQSRLRKILSEEGLKPTQINAEIERLLPKQDTLRTILYQNSFRKALLNKGFSLVQIDDKTAQFWPDLDILRNNLQKKGIAEDKIDLELEKLVPTQQQLINRLQKEGVQIKEIDDEIKQFFPEDNHDNFTITKEAVEMLLIDIGQLNP